MPGTEKVETESLISGGSIIEVPKPASKDRRMTFSSTIGNLALAMSKAQGAMDAVKKGKQGYGYKYSDLASVLSTLREPFAKNELAIVQGHELA